ncbi:MAG: diguanylate cyclase [Butyrivibrio sp.]|uniref:GGDEF domain-containing protein n=1 Tax=Butyrivibrio sp. TaxID=28121 RepID=UPI0025B9EDD9|nr:GGDEF domain-containing protein [Butyrivibrio sp.]MBQ6589769.1 diguanylate cyclase [Butyrivibrio sp.]
MSTKVRMRTVLMALGALILMGFVISFLGSDRLKSPKHFNLVQLEEGWTVTHAQKSYTPDKLSEVDIGIAGIDDVITLTKILDNYDVNPATIHFRSILSAVDIYLDQKLIYSSGWDYVEKGLMLPKVQHFVTLPTDYVGKELTIVITPKEKNAFSGISPITLGNKEDISRVLAQDGRLALFIAVFLVMFGFVLLILSPILVYSGSHDLSIGFSGFISVLLGLYILCFNDLFWIFTENASFYTFLEYMTLFLLPASILLFLYTAKQINGPVIAMTLGLINFGFAIVTSILHFANVIHICHFVTHLHFIALVEGLFVISSLVISVYKRYKTPDEFRSKNMSTNMLLLGLLLFLFCSVVDIIKFNISKYFSTGEMNTNINFLTVGALLFMVCLVLNYFFHCIEYMNESNMKLQLEGLAYTDSLTSLANRSKCELSLAELEGDYTIVSIDLDYLKYTNDNFGHLEGDRLISEFANILGNSFTDASLIGRMGGDEFIVILPYIDESRISRDIDCFNDLLEYKNKQETHLKFSASYGFANSSDEKIQDSPTAQNVYLLADARMYKMKNAHHKQSLGRLYNDLVKKIGKEGGSNE